MYVSTFNVIFYTPLLKKRMESPFGWKILVEYVAVDKKVEGALLRPWIQRFGSIKAIIILKCRYFLTILHHEKMKKKKVSLMLKEHYGYENI